MSQPSSNDEMFGELADMEEMTSDAQAPAPEPQYRSPTFDIYSMLMLLSFLFTTTAAIIFYLNVN